jgi:hypothetical protein
MSRVYAVALSMFGVAIIGCPAAPPAAPIPESRRPKRAVTDDQRRTIEKHVKEINDEPLANAQYTVAMTELAIIGEPAIPFVLPLAMSDDKLTRMRAAYVLYDILLRHACHNNRDETEALWTRLGPIDWEDESGDGAEHRKAAIRLWEEWMDKR